MTPDLDRLRSMVANGGDVLMLLELELVDDPNWGAPSDTSYLNDRDRDNPDIMANVDAMTATNQLIAWFGRDLEGFVGLWRGPNHTPLHQAPIVRLDSEGQYSLVAETIGDYIAITLDHERFEEHRQALSKAGLTVRESPTAIWDSVSGSDEPNDYRHVLYNEGRVRRGLEPIAQP
jgi:hypothetical protein